MFYFTGYVRLCKRLAPEHVPLALGFKRLLYTHTGEFTFTYLVNRLAACGDR